MDQASVTGEELSSKLHTAYPIIAWPKRSKSDPFTDWDIRNISDALSRSGYIHWSKVPRIYAVLHSISQIHAMKAFLEDSVTDLGFPFTNQTLPHAFSDQAARKEFLDAQPLVASKVLEFEQGSKHYHFSSIEEVPLLKLSELGRGQFGSVDRVRSEVSFREYARKLIPRGRTFQKDKKILRDFENELHSLRKLSHHHIVQLVSSYTDPKFVGIIMSPVADCNLKEYLWGNFEPSLVRTFFGCLAVAVRFLHEHQVRHKDIKPQNVLVYKGTVLFTDFGISRDWAEAGRETTTGQTALTPKYCAPEVADWGPRNSSSDIWSLGCVFLEMFAVISGFSICQLSQYLETHGSHSSNYQLNHTGVQSWCDFAWPHGISPGPLSWIQNMMKFEKSERWTAQKLSDCIQEQTEHGEISYVGQCCDTAVGSPQTVESPPTDNAMEFVSSVSPADGARSSSNPDTSTFGSLGIRSLAVASNTTSSMHYESPDHNQVQQQKRSSSKRPLTATQRETSTKNKKRGQTQQTKVYSDYRGSADNSDSLRRRLPVKKRSNVEGDGQKSLPYCFLMAQRNRLSRQQVLGFIAASHNIESLMPRSTRGSRGSEKIIFCYGDYMLPDVIYAETCVRSKPSQYAQWSTLEGLIRHMTPAVLYGYGRFCPDASEGLNSIPTVKATGSITDEVRGMLVFGWHDSHTQGSRKYESKHEHDVEEEVVLELQDGNTMKVGATLRVWNEDLVDRLTPYDCNWEPHDMLQSEWYALMPRSVKAEDMRLEGSFLETISNKNAIPGIPRRALPKRTTHSLRRVRRNSVQERVMSQEQAMPRTNQNGDGDFCLTEDLIGELFYSGVTSSTCLDLCGYFPTNLFSVVLNRHAFSFSKLQFNITSQLAGLTAFGPQTPQLI